MTLQREEEEEKPVQQGKTVYHAYLHNQWKNKKKKKKKSQLFDSYFLVDRSIVNGNLLQNAYSELLTRQLPYEFCIFYGLRITLD